jgi:two-component system osmolarity sensor histidine kinase EnvZ
VARELRARLGPDTMVASSVNGRRACGWASRSRRDPYWLQAEAARCIHPLTARHLGDAGWASRCWPPWWARWLIARLINQPLKQLSFAASRIRGGEFDSRLDENTLTSEIREVNMGFNRMARELAKVEEDRAVMLAGISHDLRTPLARLRLEAEMSVTDEEAKRNMAADIDQLDAIIDKFMDYARPGETHLQPGDAGAADRQGGGRFPRPHRDPHHLEAWPSTSR